MASSAERPLTAERAPVRPAQPERPRPADACRTEEQAECPACGSPMRLWAAYYRCRTCGYKESCCF